MNLIDVIEEAIESNQTFPNESQAEYIHRYIRPHIVVKKEFDSLQQEINSLDKINEDDVINITRETIGEEIHIEEIKKMYSEIKKMHQELIDKQGVL